jgi:hypothetical protein
MIGWGMGPLAGLGMLVFWILFVGLVVWVAFNGYTGQVWYHTWHGKFIGMVDEM